MASLHNPEHIAKYVDGFEALDTNSVSKSYIIRNVSVRILFIVYIASLFFDLEQFLSITLATLGSFYILTQVFLLERLIRHADYSLKDWMMLYKRKSRFARIIIWLLFFTAIGLFGQAIYVSEVMSAIPEGFNIFQSAFFSVFLLVYITSSLTDEIATPIMQLRFNSSLFQSPEQEVLVDDSEATRQHQYRQLAIKVIQNENPFQQKMQDKKTQDDSTFTVQSETEWNDSHDESFSEVRERALTKLKSMRGKESAFKRSRETFALTPEELDELTEEEVDALLSGPAN